MYGVFDKAGEQLRKGRREQEFETRREAEAFRAQYASKVAARSESDYDVLEIEGEDDSDDEPEPDTDSLEDRGLSLGSYGS